MTRPGPIGSRVDRYEVQRLLGTGGFGTVYRARHVHTEAVVALKLLKRTLSADPQVMERFLREARAAAAVGDEHIVGVLDAGVSSEGQGFLALEYLDGMDLKELAVREGPLPPMRIGLIALQVLGALKATHAKGIIHRDMKPANVFILRRTDELGVERDFAKVLDFGISRIQTEGSGLTMIGVGLGTPTYMAPEQFFDARGVDARADLYSVAAMLYELLGNRLPFDADSYAALVLKVRTEDPLALLELSPRVSRSLAEVVMRGLAKEREQRWQSATDFADALREALDGHGQELLTPRRSTPSPGPSARPATLSAEAPGRISLSLLEGNSSPSQAEADSARRFTAYASKASPTQGGIPASRRDQTVRWALIALGLIFLAGGCCTCGFLARRAHQDDEPIIDRQSNTPTRARVASRALAGGSSRVGSAPTATAPSPVGQ